MGWWVLLVVGCDGCVMPLVEVAVVLRGCDEKETAVFAILPVIIGVNSPGWCTSPPPSPFRPDTIDSFISPREDRVFEKT